MKVAKRIDGKAKAAQLAESITLETATLLEEHGIKPGLAVVIIGENPASQVYVRNKKRTADPFGSAVRVHFSLRRRMNRQSRGRTAPIRPL